MAPVGRSNLINTVEIHAVEVLLGPFVVGVYLGFRLGAVFGFQFLSEHRYVAIEELLGG